MFSLKKTKLPKLVMTLLVRDSEDTLRENIEFHLNQGVDFIIAMDHLSVDGSTSILKDYESQKLLHYIHQPSKAYYQSKWVTKMARLAAHKYTADWVINNDSDEFWWPSNSSKSLKEVLLEQPDDINIISCERKNFILPSEEQYDKLAPFYQRMIYKDLCSQNILGGPLPPKVAHRASRWVRVGAGNHDARFIWPEKQAKADIEIFHFPFRNTRQVKDRIGICRKLVQYSGKSQISPTRREFDKLDSSQKLNEFIQRVVYSNQKIKLGLSNGSLVEDVRIRDYLNGLR